MKRDVSVKNMHLLDLKTEEAFGRGVKRDSNPFNEPKNRTAWTQFFQAISESSFSVDEQAILPMP